MGFMIGNYEVLDKLGSGAMGDVFKGRDPKKNQIVAIKMLSEDLSNNQRAVERFKREIRQTLQLDHPNLIAAYDAGEFKGRLYYVMEYVDGVTVKKEMLQKGAYEESRTVEIMIQISKALEYAAQFGIIHRDIKPDNIMMTHDGRAKLCDMGLAKSTDSGSNLTVFGTVLGTPHYMSPEQAQGEEKLDTRSDIFCLGATWYHMLTNSPPFEGPDPVSIMTALAKQDPVPVYERNPKVPDSICAVVAKMMGKDRQKRYQNFTELLEDLYRVKRGEQTEAEKTGYAPTGRKALANKFRESFVPSELDVLLGKIALHNKLSTQEKMEEALHRQESLALIGINLDLGDILLERKTISPQQKGFLDQVKVQFALDRGDEIFWKACGTHNLLTPGEQTEFQKYKKIQVKGIGGILFAQKPLEEERRQKIFAALKHAVSVEESRLVLKVAIDSNLISQPQAEKCSRIYSNNVVMGKYRDIGAILLEKGFLIAEAYQAVLRAVRRSVLTGRPSAQYVEEKWIR